MSWGISPWVYPVWGSLGFLNLGDYFLPHFREGFNYYLLKYFLMVFFFLSSSSGTPMIQMLGCLTLSQRYLRLSSLLLILFFFPLCFIYFYHSIFYLIYPIVWKLSFKHFLAFLFSHKFSFLKHLVLLSYTIAFLPSVQSLSRVRLFVTP